MWWLWNKKIQSFDEFRWVVRLLMAKRGERSDFGGERGGFRAKRYDLGVNYGGL